MGSTVHARTARERGEAIIAMVCLEMVGCYQDKPGVNFSDHRSFWKEGYRAVMVTDTAFYRNPAYHTERDTIDTLDFNRMVLLLPGLVRMARDLAGD